MGEAEVVKARRKGAVGAMLDEYERAVADLVRVLEGIDEAAFIRIRDRESADENCRSIQTVMKHVIRASFNYAVAVRNAFGITTPRRDVPLPSRAECFDGLRAAMAYTEETLEGHWEMTDDEIVAVKIDSAWGVKYDLEQMLEHAIVHILRHRRQIERFLTEPKFQG